MDVLSEHLTELRVVVDVLQGSQLVFGIELQHLMLEFEERDVVSFIFEEQGLLYKVLRIVDPVLSTDVYHRLERVAVVAFFLLEHAYPLHIELADALLVIFWFVSG